MKAAITFKSEPNRLAEHRKVCVITICRLCTVQGNELNQYVVRDIGDSNLRVIADAGLYKTEIRYGTGFADNQEGWLTCYAAYNAQRLDFWKTLCSLDGKNPENDCKLLSEKIMSPRYLYRYRAVNDKNMEALLHNHLFFSSANYFDDPFDTFLHINIHKIFNEFEANFANSACLAKLSEELTNMASLVGRQFPSDFLTAISDPQKLRAFHDSGLRDWFFNYTLDLRTSIRKDTWSVCFSEDGFNETLWLKYADCYHGFSLQYDLTDEASFHCGKLQLVKKGRVKRSFLL